jgi:hypothetical protein
VLYGTFEETQTLNEMLQPGTTAGSFPAINVAEEVSGIGVESELPMAIRYTVMVENVATGPLIHHLSIWKYTVLQQAWLSVANTSHAMCIKVNMLASIKMGVYRIHRIQVG